MIGDRGVLESVFDWIGLSGLFSVLVVIFWGGRLAQRVQALEERHKDLANVPTMLARLDERTEAIQRDVLDIKDNFVRKV